MTLKPCERLILLSLAGYPFLGALLLLFFAFAGAGHGYWYHEYLLFPIGALEERLSWVGAFVSAIDQLPFLLSLGMIAVLNSATLVVAGATGIGVLRGIGAIWGRESPQDRGT